MKRQVISVVSIASIIRHCCCFSLNQPKNDFTPSSRLHERSSPVFEDVCETTGVTLTRFMHEIERINPELSELAQLFSGIQTASKAISNLVKRSQLPNSSMLGLEGAINVQGEDQKVRIFSTSKFSSIIEIFFSDFRFR